LACCCVLQHRVRSGRRSGRLKIEAIFVKPFPPRRVLVFRICYILRRLRTGSPSDETHWLPNKEMTKLCEVSDETSTNLFPPRKA